MISNSQEIYTRMLDSLRPSIAVLLAAHGYRDPFTVQHQDRVANLALAIEAQLGLGAQRLEVLRLAAVVHDIGKIAMPAEASLPTVSPRTAYLLEESFGQLWDYSSEAWARKFFENWRAQLK